MYKSQTNHNIEFFKFQTLSFACLFFVINGRQGYWNFGIVCDLCIGICKFLPPIEV